MKEELAQSFSYMFKDEDWFWKVFVGVFYLFLAFFGIGFFFIIGYQVETVRRILRNEDVLPEWKKSLDFLSDGIKLGGAILIYSGFFFLIERSIHITTYGSIRIEYVILFYIAPLLFAQYVRTSSFKSCFDVFALFSIAKKNALLFILTSTLSLVLLTATITLGWMSLIVGWPFVIFWGLLAQSYLTSMVVRASQQ